MATRGRPKKNLNISKDKTCIGLKIPTDLASQLDKDSTRNFRSRTQHILWILTDYVMRNVHLRHITKPYNVPEEKSTNQPIYTEEEMNEMYKAKERGEL